MLSTPALASDCNAIVMPTTVITADEASGSHRSVSGPRAGETAHEASRVNHRQPKADQHGGEPRAERDYEEQAEGDAMDRERAEQYHQRRGAGHDSARDAECAEALERDRGGPRVVYVPMGVGMRVGVSLVVRMFVHVAAPPGVTMDRRGCGAVLMIVTMMMIMT